MWQIEKYTAVYLRVEVRTPNFIELRLVGAELFCAGWRTDMKLIVGSRNFASTPKNMNLYGKIAKHVITKPNCMTTILISSQERNKPWDVVFPTGSPYAVCVKPLSRSAFVSCRTDDHILIWCDTDCARKWYAVKPASYLRMGKTNVVVSHFPQFS